MSALLCTLHCSHSTHPFISFNLSIIVSPNKFARFSIIFPFWCLFQQCHSVLLVAQITHSIVCVLFQTVERLQGNLSNPVRLELLTKVANKTLSLQGMYREAAKIKKLQQLRSLVKNHLHFESFEQALNQYPHILDEEKLEKYLELNLSTLPLELKVSE